jgi:hypothetical protein
LSEIYPIIVATCFCLSANFGRVTFCSDYMFAWGFDPLHLVQIPAIAILWPFNPAYEGLR